MIKVGFWDVAQDKECSETFLIKKVTNKQEAERKALTKAAKELRKRVGQAIEPFFIEEIREFRNGMAVILEFETTVSLTIPGIIRLNLKKLGKSLTIDRETTIPVSVKITEDGKLVVSVKDLTNATSS